MGSAGGDVGRRKESHPGNGTISGTRDVSYWSMPDISQLESLVSESGGLWLKCKYPWGNHCFDSHTLLLYWVEWVYWNLFWEQIWGGKEKNREPQVTEIIREGGRGSLKTPPFPRRNKTAFQGDINLLYLQTILRSSFEAPWNVTLLLKLA